MRFFLCNLLAALLLPLSSRSEVLGEIHSQYRDGLMWLKVDVTGKREPLNCLLDSGAGISVIVLAKHLRRTLAIAINQRSDLATGSIEQPGDNQRSFLRRPSLANMFTGDT
jgi:hypothetical protein